MSAKANIAKLPERCYLVNPKNGTFDTEAPIICLVAGEAGFYPTGNAGRYADVALVNVLNKSVGAEPHHIEAMTYGSCFGWHVPAADADYWKARTAAA